MINKNELPVHIFSTAPQSADFAHGDYLEKLIQVSQWSEAAGCKGMLVYTDNRLVDPWLVAQVVIQNTTALCPLVAIQPVYMHPYSVAKMIASLGYFYGRQLYMNMVAGGFKNDLLALNDQTPHDQRYERLHEYTTIIMELLRGKSLSFSGKFYKTENLSLKPPLPSELLPGVFVSGSSEAGMAAAKALGATAVEYPKPSGDYAPAASSEMNSGIRIGIIADETNERAWEIANKRFPGDRKGQIAHMVAMKVSDSSWHKQLSELDKQAQNGASVYWLWPFKNYNTFCPYLVGSYDEVAEEVSKYISAGFRTFILDIPAEEWDLRCAGIVFRLAAEKAGLAVTT